jgi:hypothetical protein
MKYKSFKARILVDGTQLSEYDTTTTDAQGVPCISCWIPSEAGKVRRYILRLRLISTSSCLPDVRDQVRGRAGRASAQQLAVLRRRRARVEEGARGHGRPGRRHPPGRPRRRRTAAASHVLLSFDHWWVSTVMPSLPVLMDMTDDDAAEGLSSAALGEIMVTVLPIRVRARATGHTKGAVHLTEGTIHERSKKAGAHVVGCVCSVSSSRHELTSKTDSDPYQIDQILRRRLRRSLVRRSSNLSFDIAPSVRHLTYQTSLFAAPSQSFPAPCSFCLGDISLTPLFTQTSPSALLSHPSSPTSSSTPGSRHRTSSCDKHSYTRHPRSQRRGSGRQRAPRPSRPHGGSFMRMEMRHPELTYTTQEQMARISSRSRSIVKPEPIHVSLSASNEVIDLVSD